MMKRTLMKMFPVLIYALVLINLLSVSGCNKSNINECKMLPYWARYTRLTHDHFQKIIADEYAISSISISYGSERNPDWFGTAQETSGISLDASLRKRTGDPFSTFLNYEGNYHYYNLEGGGFDRLEVEHEFSAKEVNDLIFSYLEEGDNEDYFFDGSEYKGLRQPFEYGEKNFGEADLSIIISFREPGTIYDSWAICKSMFADEPHPILQGLINIIEDNFISQIEKEDDEEDESIDPGNNMEFSPLEYSKFSALRTETDQFSIFTMFYSNKGEGYSKRMLILAGQHEEHNLLSSLKRYEGVFKEDRSPPNPRESIFLRNVFAIEDLEVIFNYIEDNNNRDYFFDGSEYSGRYPPAIKSYSPTICEDDYRFGITFVEPGKMREAWAIHKCSDTPNPILLGLIELLEDKIISQFEEEVVANSIPR